MPVWHELTREARESGELVLIGITQEQHPDRCRLYAQWQGLDWPILWDPFNLTGSKVVPNAVAIDEHGLVRSVAARPDSFLEDFMEREFAAPEQAASVVPLACAYGERHGRAPSAVEWGMRGQAGLAIEALEARLSQHPDDARSAFRAGVARRMRHDSAEHQTQDFQRAIEHWTLALSLDPNQYIWRRRIQQYGPRMDKPYPFYDWIETAQRELQARGEWAPELLAVLTPAELAEPRRAAPAQSLDKRAEPDPGGRIERDSSAYIRVESALVFDTSQQALVASLHLSFRPNALLDAHWNHENGPALEVWLEGPEGWELSTQRLVSAARQTSASSSEALHMSLELSAPKGTAAGLVRGYGLYYVCEGVLGSCRYLRQDFQVQLLRTE